MSEIIEKVIHLFENHGDSQYGGEAVSQLEHALQAAHFADEAGEKTNIIVAGILHDIGHLLHDLPDDAPLNGVDDVHENKAAVYLRKYFPEEVTEPVRLHVEAKRYLSTTDSTYYDLLSEPSKQSLALQGGLMSKDELALFEQNSFFSDATKLRKWDDQAKIKGLPTEPIEYYTAHLSQSLRIYFSEDSL